MQQQRFTGKDSQLIKPYSNGPYNVVRGNEQRIRISEGCPHNCPFCYEPTETKLFPIPEIVKRKVSIMDMNLLCKPQALQIIEELGAKRIKGKVAHFVVHYELMCGIDHRFLTQKLADVLYQNRFKHMRLAWDWDYRDQMKIKDAIDKLLKAGYQNRDLMVFMICNWRIPFDENLKKLDLCKVWRVKVCDCYFDGQVSPHIIPVFWTGNQIVEFRAKVRKHNQLVNFGVDPEID